MDPDEQRARLASERERLQGIHDSFPEPDHDEVSSYDQHQADVGSETFDRERDLSILENVEAELADVEHALARLDDGTYGTCEACGKRIADDRLDAMPAARFCVDDQAMAEREAHARPTADESS